MTNKSPPQRGGFKRTSTNDEAMLLLRDRQQASIDLNQLLQKALADTRVVDKYQTFRVRYLLALGKLRPVEYEEPEDMDETETAEYLRQLRIEEKEKKDRCSKLQSAWLLYDTLASDKPSAYSTEDRQIEEEMDEFEEEIAEEWQDFAEEVLARAEFEGNQHEPDIADWNFELKEIRKDLKLIQRRKDERAEIRENELSRVRDMLRRRRGEDTSENGCDASLSNEDECSKRTEKTSKTSKTSKSSKSKREHRVDKGEDRPNMSEHVDDENGEDKMDQTAHSVSTKKKRKDKKSSKKSGKKDKHKKKHSDMDSQDRLLEEVFPAHIAQALREGKKPEPESHECVTIFFSDILGFTKISSELSPLKVSDMLDRLYQKFDALSHEHDVYKVETIGDSWMGVTNLVKDQPDHVQRVAHFALDALRAAQDTWIDEDDRSLGRLNLRVGFHSGPVVANVVGSRNPRYCLFGDTVNTSSRMESHSLPGRIHCSATSASMLKKNVGELFLTTRGFIQIKGKGVMETYFVSDKFTPLGLDPGVQSMLASPQRISKVFGKDSSGSNAHRPVRRLSFDQPELELLLLTDDEEDIDKPLRPKRKPTKQTN
eukprot:scaffold3240_cov187-Amphora_coffeaeformis.AAC.21